ncbi:MAG: hypothetical protein Q8P02_02910 [Candidatus Micrarchaeota archaeon]|nr:hypothetical protein [Candidatus Micrarchaeota archaeon]
MALDVSGELRVSKHFRNTWMRKWGWDMNDLRDAIKHAYRTDAVGKNKHEVYTRHKCGGKSRKLVVVPDGNDLFVITGAQGT